MTTRNGGGAGSDLAAAGVVETRSATHTTARRDVRRI
jgi:hypothetical protein